MSGDLPSSELLTHGRAVLDWIASYLDRPERYEVLSRVVPGEIREMLPSSPPEEGEPIGRILGDFEQQIIPDFEKTTGHRVVAWWGPPNLIQTKLSASEPVDVIFSGQSLWKDWIAAS